jgi:hypothetical protein
MYTGAEKRTEAAMLFQILRIELDERGNVISRRPLQPCYELRDHALAMAEFDAAQCWGEYGYDNERDCWWARDTSDRMFRFEIENVPANDVAA